LSSVGRKKLKQVEAEIQRLTFIRHPNLLSVFAVKLNMPYSSGPQQLIILSEQGPALSLQDILEDCESLREERASVCLIFFYVQFVLLIDAVQDYLSQILTALNEVHAADLVHRGTPTLIIRLMHSS